MNGLIRLDGATATELMRAGLKVREPWWTTLALNSEASRTVLRRVHGNYLAAGAQVITANTFRCNLRALRRLGLDDAGHAWMVHAAVGVARSACAGGSAQIAAAMSPVEDCYRPDLVPPGDELAAEHRWLATELMRAGVDLVLIETMNTAREARTALEQVLAVGGTAWVSFVCDPGGRLLSGESLAAAARAVEQDGAQAVLVNCTTPDATEYALRELRDACSGPVGAYPNIEDTADRGRTRGEQYVPPAMSPEEFAARTAGWRERFLIDILGGCCGTTPEHMMAAYGVSQSLGIQPLPR